SSDYSSQNNTFISNMVSDNPGYGLFVRYGENNSFTENTFSNNSIGIIIVGGERNYKIFNNYFNNSNNSRVQGSSNRYDIWNTTKQPLTNIIGGTYLGGNFWAHPDGTGFSQTCPDNNKDGICDIEYTLNENNTDYLPLAATGAISPRIQDLNQER
ncbi:MAG: NosD domain-containing protein, partial [Candidatus Methanoperedens sp.]|nr:NosD domain-containing protein [Candidatus Methanoperedens sp.]